jgi:hypothetical protein
MKSLPVLVVAAAIALGGSAFTSCSSGTGQGAAAGAIGGAVVGGPVGAAVGAIGGAIVGTAIHESDASRYAPAPATGYPMAVPLAQPGFFRSPYSGETYDLRDVPPRALVRDSKTNQLFRKP